jgi:hypothetical protein
MTEDATLEYDFDEGVDREAGAKSVGPLRALRRHCLWCCNGSANEVKLCAATSCPLWTFRLGHRPAAEEKAAVATIKLYPFERPAMCGAFHVKGATALKAIRRGCRGEERATEMCPQKCVFSDPIAWGLVAELAKPGGNITGIDVDVGYKVGTKRLEMLREAIPSLTKVGWLASGGVWDGPAGIDMREAAQPPR